MNKISMILLVTINLLIGSILLFTTAVKQFELSQINILIYVLGAIMISSVSIVAIVYSRQKSKNAYSFIRHSSVKHARYRRLANK